MKNRKSFLLLLCILAFCGTILTACGGKQDDGDGSSIKETSSNDEIKRCSYKGDTEELTLELEMYGVKASYSEDEIPSKDDVDLVKAILTTMRFDDKNRFEDVSVKVDTTNNIIYIDGTEYRDLVAGDGGYLNQSLDLPRDEHAIDGTNMKRYRDAGIVQYDVENGVVRIWIRYAVTNPQKDIDAVYLDLVEFTYVIN